MAQPTTETAKPRRSLKRAPPAKFKDGVSDPRGLPPACYTSAAFHEREIETIFRKEWVCIGRVEDVAKPGDYVSIDIVGEPLVMVRDLEGNLRVHSRICRHRSMILVEGAGNARSFNCPYHAWVYGLDGRLAGAPEMEYTPGFDRAACRLPGPKVELWEGFVFVNFDPKAKPLAPRVEKLTRFLGNWHMGEMVAVRSFDFHVGWNWKVMIDNYIEAYHHLGAHRLSLEPVMPTRLVRVEDLSGPFTIVHMPHVEGTEVSGFYTTGEEQAKLPAIPTLTEDERRRPSLIHMFPAHLMSTHHSQDHVRAKGRARAARFRARHESGDRPVSAVPRRGRGCERWRHAGLALALCRAAPPVPSGASAVGIRGVAVAAHGPAARAVIPPS
ncbi:MAG: aromatic ring-hydroxylating dioxygenase subunit alpha [Alphaproteobacteria bacterium]|nr:aromatic ring-hydroxylating dioxygenase subunit alpha [Alphaproteobacteria bacterium]